MQKGCVVHETSSSLQVFIYAPGDFRPGFDALLLEYGEFGPPTRPSATRLMRDWLGSLGKPCESSLDGVL